MNDNPDGISRTGDEAKAEWKRHLQQQLDELLILARDAKALTRSGNPAVKAEGKAALKNINAMIRDLKKRLGDVG